LRSGSPRRSAAWSRLQLPPNGETLSEFVRQAARREAERTLAERTRYVIDDEAAQRFLAALEQPSPDAARKLRRLIEKPSVLPAA
jgi:uncharacterized protein (DUF1778 family)